MLKEFQGLLLEVEKVEAALPEIKAGSLRGFFDRAPSRWKASEAGVASDGQTNKNAGPLKHGPAPIAEPPISSHERSSTRQELERTGTKLGF